MKTLKLFAMVLVLAGAGCTERGALNRVLRDVLAPGADGDANTVGEVTDTGPTPGGPDGSEQPVPQAGVMEARVRNESGRSAEVTIRFLLNNIVVHFAERRVGPLTTTSITGPDVAQIVEFTAVDQDGTPLPPAAFVFEAGQDNLVVYVIFECAGDGDCDDGAFCDGAERCVEGSCEAGPTPCPADHCDESADACFECLNDGECDDGLFCTGVERCVEGTCRPGAGPCPDLRCDANRDRCVECLEDAQCADGLFCNGDETCADGVCQLGTDPCPGEDCDEVGDACVVIGPPAITDCNHNGIADVQDIREGTSNDCDSNGIPDECEDCNTNGTPDVCDVACEFEGCSFCFDGDPASCADDCNSNLVPDECDLESGVSDDRNEDGVPDECEDCNDNGVMDTLDIESGTSEDCNINWVPDECDTADGSAGGDLNENGVPDECEDCNTNGTPDDLDIASETSQDCNTNNLPDECDIAAGTSLDVDTNGLPDECTALYAVERFSAALSILDPETGQLTFVANMFPNVGGAFGLAYGPDAQMYAVVEDVGTLGVVSLATVDLPSGFVTPIGNISEPVSDIAFGSDGVLYGVLDQNAGPGGEIVTIDITDASISTTGLIGSNGAGQSIANQPGTNLFFHTFCPGPCGLEIIDVAAGTVTFTAPLDNAYQALTYDSDNERLIGSSFRAEDATSIFAIDPVSGSESFLSDASSNVRITGMAFGPGPFPSGGP